MWNDILLRLRALISRRRMDEELQEELQFHINMQARKNRAYDLDPAEAERKARVQFGSLVDATEECREQRGISTIDILVKDVRFGLRKVRIMTLNEQADPVRRAVDAEDQFKMHLLSTISYNTKMYKEDAVFVDAFERFVRHCARIRGLSPRQYPRGVFRFRTLDEAQAARARADAQDPR